MPVNVQANQAGRAKGAGLPPAMKRKMSRKANRKGSRY